LGTLQAWRSTGPVDRLPCWQRAVGSGRPLGRPSS